MMCKVQYALTLPELLLQRQNLPQNKVSLLLLCLLRRKLAIFISLLTLLRPRSGWFPDCMGLN